MEAGSWLTRPDFPGQRRRATQRALSSGLSTTGPHAGGDDSFRMRGFVIGMPVTGWLLLKIRVSRFSNRFGVVRSCRSPLMVSRDGINCWSIMWAGWLNALIIWLACHGGMVRHALDVRLRCRPSRSAANLSTCDAIPARTATLYVHTVQNERTVAQVFDW